MTDSLDVALRALTAARGGSILLAAGALALPVAAVVLLARWRPPGGRALQAGQRTLGSLGSLVALAVALLAGSAAADRRHAVEAPARGRVARAVGAPVADAIERYRADHGAYPRRLDGLVPRYLPDSVLRAAERSPLGHPLQLERVHEHFVLRVRERAPGVSSCDYVSATRRWYCSGYF